MLDETFFALANETRRAIVRRLLAGDATVGQLAAPLAMTVPAVSKHLSVLERAGLVTRERRGRERVCRVDPTRLTPAAEWIEQQRAFWTHQLDALGNYVTYIDRPEVDT